MINVCRLIYSFFILLFFICYMYPSTDAGDTNLITNAQAGNIDYAFCKDSAQVQQLQAMEGYKVDTVNVTFPRYIFVNMFERPAK